MGLTCPPPGECQTQGVCDPATGTCAPNPPKAKDTPCGAGACDGAGVCGEGKEGSSVPPLAFGIVRAASFHCAAPAATAKTAGHAASVTAAHSPCAAVDRCAGVTCPMPTECQSQGTCDPVNGTCAPNPPKARDTPCSAGACDGTGVCGAGGWAAAKLAFGVVCFADILLLRRMSWCCRVGKPSTASEGCPPPPFAAVDRCVGVTCSAANDCQTQGACDPATGTCAPNLPKAKDTPCSAGACNGAGVCGQWGSALPWLLS